MTAHSLLLCALALATASVPASAQDLLKFAQKYKGVYRSEISDTSAFETEFVVRTKIGESYGTNISYDDATGVATLKLNSVENKLGMTALVDRCKSLGRAKGVTRFGLKATYTRQSCQRVFVRGYDDFALGELEGKNSASAGSLIKVPLSPGEFRRFKAAGYLEIAVTLTPALESGLVVEHSTSYSSATLDYPYETLMDVYHLPAVVSKIEYFLPSAKVPFVVQE
jgi:hypothetical protein